MLTLASFSRGVAPPVRDLVGPGDGSNGGQSRALPGASHGAMLTA
jgi:hypothetical protein